MASVALICVFVVISFSDIVSSMDIDDGIQALCLEGSTFPHNISVGNDTVIVDKCEAFYKTFVEYAGAFTDCELTYSRPFRICKKCLVQHELTFVTYRDFSVSTVLW